MTSFLLGRSEPKRSPIRMDHLVSSRQYGSKSKGNVGGRQRPGYPQRLVGEKEAAQRGVAYYHILTVPSMFSHFE